MINDPMSDFLPGIHIDVAELIALQVNARGINFHRYKKIQQSLNGNFLSRLRGRGMDFAEVRTYQSGDDIRHMDWRVTARTGVAHTKLYTEERERPVFLLVDFAPTMYFATRQAFKSVIAAKLAALVGWSAIQQGDRLGALVFSEQQHLEFRPQLRQQGIMPLLHSLSDFCKNVPPTNQLRGGLTHALARLRRVVKPGSLVVLISDFQHFDTEDELYLAQMSQHNQVLALRVRDPLEITLPPPNHYVISDGAELSEIDWSNNATRQACQQHFDKQEERIRKALQRYSIPLIEFFTHQSVSEKLSQVFGDR